MRVKKISLKALHVPIWETWSTQTQSNHAQLRTRSVTFLGETCSASWLSPPCASLKADRCRGDREAPKLDEFELLHAILAGSAPLFSSAAMKYSISVILSGLISGRHLLIVLAHLDSIPSTLLHFCPWKHIAFRKFQIVQRTAAQV